MQKIKILLNIFTLLLCTLPITAAAQTGGNVTVSGVVTSSEDRQPLIGVNVISGATSGVSTLVDGSYTLNVTEGTKLTFQYIGFKSEEFIVPAGMSQVTHNVAMESDAQRLDDVVVVAYGVRKKGTIAGSVSTVKADKINDVPAASFDQALQGRTPGMSVLSVSGEPSAPAVFQIRGMNSINSGTEPLIILDGVAISSGDYSAINPSDIESINILKDASSTSIYGARAANGVIVVTSKRGRVSDKATVTYRMQLGLSNIAFGKWNMMNTRERIAYEKEIGIDTGQNYDELSKIDIDWRKEVFTNNAPLRNYEISVGGASNAVNYYVSAGYFRQKGIAQQSDFERYSIRANLEAKASNWLKIGTNNALSYEDIEEAVDGAYYTNTPITAARFMMPYWRPYNEDGSVASIYDGTWLGTKENPIEWAMHNPMSSKRYKVISSTFAEITFTKGLTFKTLLGVDFSYRPSRTASTPSYPANDGIGLIGRGASSAFNFTNSNTLNYQFELSNDHSFNFLLGHEFVNNDAEGFSVTTRGQNNDRLQTLSTGTMASNWGDDMTQSAYLSFFTRGEYNYKNLYYADFSVRGEASSRFGRNARWGAFWSVGLMWNLRNEQFLKNATWLTNAQIALSTGTSGNSSIPAYEHLALVSGGPLYNGIAGIAPLSLGNEDLTWEETWSSNLALRFGAWNRLNASIEFYNKKTTNMLMAVPQSFTTGYSYRWENVGAMINRGIELDINGDVIRTRDFTWNLSANFSYNRDKITELYNGLDRFEMSNTGQMLMVGHPSGEFYINRYAGVNPANGESLWYTKDGDLTNEIRDEDKVMIGKSSNAPWQGGFGTTLSWKGLSLNVLFSWVADRWMLNNDRWIEESNGTFQTYNQSKRLLYDRWKKPGDITDIPKHGEPTYLDSHLLEDASFMRLKNVTLSYSLPHKLLQKTRFFEGARVYVQGQNLFTFTNFTGMDPESYLNIYQAQYPMSRQFTFGLELTF